MNFADFEKRKSKNKIQTFIDEKNSVHTALTIKVWILFWFGYRKKSKRLDFLRHSHASLLINQGCDALILADRLGHEKVSTTLNTYSHLFPHKQQELVTNLEQLATNAPVTPTPEPPMGNPLLDTLEKTSGKVIPMPQRKAI